MDLVSLSAEIEQQVVQLRAAAPELDDEAVQERAWSAMQSKGIKTRQMRHTKLSSAHAGLVSKAASLGEARSKLAEVKPERSARPPPRCRSGSLGSGRRTKCAAKSKKASPSRSRSSGFASFDVGEDALECGMECESSLFDSSVLDDMEERVETVEDTVSYAQVSRMYAKGKKCGKW